MTKTSCPRHIRCRQEQRRPLCRQARSAPGIGVQWWWCVPRIACTPPWKRAVPCSADGLLCSIHIAKPMSTSPNYCIMKLHDQGDGLQYGQPDIGYYKLPTDVPIDECVYSRKSMGPYNGFTNKQATCYVKQYCHLRSPPKGEYICDWTGDPGDGNPVTYGGADSCG